jgi:hypothetical protein
LHIVVSKRTAMARRYRANTIAHSISSPTLRTATIVHRTVAMIGFPPATHVRR